MPREAKSLSAKAVEALKLPGLHMVGGVRGLGLQVTPTGARSWILRATVNGKRRDMGLGRYAPDFRHEGVTLSQARETAIDWRREIAAGIDPLARRNAAKAADQVRQLAAVTFKQVTHDYLAANEAGWRNPKHRAQWRSSLESYAFPLIGHKAVGEVDTELVLRVLQQPIQVDSAVIPLWEARPETASRIRGRIETILDYAKVRRLREGENPAAWRNNLRSALPSRRKLAAVKHHQALPVSEVGEFMAGLRTAPGFGARALEFAILTAARSGEVRGARWSEIDLEARIWTVPAARMKAGKEHRVPLSRAAMHLLKDVPRLEGSDHVFPSSRGGALSDATLLAVLKRMGVNAVPHGFRSTFRDWVSERTGFSPELAEMALAHTIANKVEAAYRRGDLFEKRRRLMDDWATFLSRPERGKVLPFGVAQGGGREG